jgi:hypothetical protein
VLVPPVFVLVLLPPEFVLVFVGVFVFVFALLMTTFTGGVFEPPPPFWVFVLFDELLALLFAELLLELLLLFVLLPELLTSAFAFALAWTMLVSVSMMMTFPYPISVESWSAPESWSPVQVLSRWPLSARSAKICCEVLESAEAAAGATRLAAARRLRVLSRSRITLST